MESALDQAALIVALHIPGAPPSTPKSCSAEPSHTYASLITLEKAAQEIVAQTHTHQARATPS